MTLSSHKIKWYLVKELEKAATRATILLLYLDKVWNKQCLKYEFLVFFIQLKPLAYVIIAESKLFFIYWSSKSIL